MSSYNQLLTSGVQNSISERKVLRKRIEPVYINGKLLIDIPDPVENRLRQVKRELGGIFVAQSFMFVFGEKVILSAEDAKEAVRMGITIEQELVIISRK